MHASEVLTTIRHKIVRIYLGKCHGREQYQADCRVSFTPGHRSPRTAFSIAALGNRPWANEKRTLSIFDGFRLTMRAEVLSDFPL